MSNKATIIEFTGLNHPGYEIGDILQVTNERHICYGKAGRVVGKGIKGGYYLQFDDKDESIYIPFGYKKIKPKPQNA